MDKLKFKVDFSFGSIGIFVLVVLSVFFAGCDMNSVSNGSGHGYYNQVERTSINDYFGRNVTEYSEVNLAQTYECLEGSCEVEPFENKTYVRSCYFCESELLEDERFALIGYKDSSGSSDFFAGCSRKYSGNEMDGFDIVEKRDDLLRVRGDISTYYSQKGIVCNVSYDPECDDSYYGTCPGGDYSIKYTREVEFVFE